MIQVRFENRWKWTIAMTRSGKTVGIIGLFYSKNINGYGVKEISIGLLNFWFIIYWGIK